MKGKEERGGEKGPLGEEKKNGRWEREEGRKGEEMEGEREEERDNHANPEPPSD